MNDKTFFIERRGCPFCQKQSNHVLSSTHYHDTAEANRNLPNIFGKLFYCKECGVAYPSHSNLVSVFPKVYQKTFKDLKYFDNSFMQIIRKKYLKEILRNHHKIFSFSRFLDFPSLFVFQVPLVSRKPNSLKVLDVGCGFGEFLLIYKELGNDVIGTEIISELVAKQTIRGLDCRFGELDEIDFNGIKFNVIILRGVFYRTSDPCTILKLLKNLLSPDGEIAIMILALVKMALNIFLKNSFRKGNFIS